MPTFAKPCSICQTLTKNGRFCKDCAKAHERTRIRPSRAKAPTAARGYDSRWKRLSERARSLQPFCTDCGATEHLQADHTPEAWKRYEQGLPIRLTDIEVVCRACNIRRGAARGKNARSHK